jgi:hypothetical protein
VGEELEVGVEVLVVEVWELAAGGVQREAGEAEEILVHAQGPETSR